MSHTKRKAQRFRRGRWLPFGLDLNRPPYETPRAGHAYARKTGAERGWLFKAFLAKRKDEIAPAARALRAFPEIRLPIYFRDTAERRADAWERLRAAFTKLWPIEAKERLHDLEFPVPFPLMTNLVAFVLVMLVVVPTGEAIFIEPGLPAVGDYPDNVLWTIAFAVGGTYTVIELLLGEAIAYVIGKPHHRKDPGQKYRWWLFTGVAVLGTVIVFALPPTINHAREHNRQVVEVLQQQAQPTHDQGLSGAPTPWAAAPRAEQKRPEKPRLGWTVLVQWAVLTAGLVHATLWAAGRPYRAYLRSERERAAVHRGIEAAATPLEALAFADAATELSEYAEHEYRHAEFVRTVQRAAFTEGVEPPPITDPEAPRPAAEVERDAVETPLTQVRHRLAQLEDEMAAQLQLRLRRGTERTPRDLQVVAAPKGPADHGTGGRVHPSEE